MEIQPRVHGTSTVLELTGRFTFEDHPTFKAALTQLWERTGAKAVTLDFSGLSYLDSSALGLMLLMRERAAAAGVKLVIRRPSEAVRKLILVVNFDRLFEIQG
ncbi:MAG TPA: STAS domain-containing protein [Holophagaceae bacterium]|nr:STAS domain-containing protein [Holophagaceae bacterium]